MVDANTPPINADPALPLNVVVFPNPLPARTLKVVAEVVPAAI
jgi:hypothetical protein